MRDLLERVCKELMRNESLQMTDLSARIGYIASQFDLSVAEQNRLHTFRLTSNDILNNRKVPEEPELLRDAKTLSFFIRKVHGVDIPEQLYRLLPRADATYIIQPPGNRKIQRMRVCFQYADEDYLYVSPVDTVSDTLLKVRYNIPEINEEFAETCELLWRYAQINLLDVTEDEDGILTPFFIVLEPDYLIDISSLAECYKDYGHHPANYQLNKLQVIENQRPLLLGNIANLFLDEWINTSGEVDYMECMRKAFRRYPIELAACADLYDKDTEREFFEDCRKHFNHIRKTVEELFPMPGYKLDKNDAVLEPSYMCEALGLQGRLDYMQRDMSAFIEMKSGKADEYSLHNKIEPKENNRVQMLLYQAVLQYSMGKDHREVNAYLLYTRYPLLYPARSSWAMVRRIINLRNRIVSDEYGMQLRNSREFTYNKLKQINSQVLNEKQLSGRFWEQYLSPSIDKIAEKLSALDTTERAYFVSLYNFITKEQYTSKSGDTDYEGSKGAAALWLNSLADKIESGEIICNLRIIENHASDEHKPYIVFKQHTEIPTGEIQALPNFRLGDAVVLYQRNHVTDNVTNKLVFKGNIEEISDNGIRVRLRSSQKNSNLLPAESDYTVEHDTMDSVFKSMFQGLSLFLSANKERRDLLLSRRLPRYDSSFEEDIKNASTDLDRIILKAQAVEDYFLLVGPPGTGKTSHAIRRMVETFYARNSTQILLLAYTNRAVDEICKALLSIEPKVNFIRIGSELSCETAYRAYLVENVLSDCNRRSEVKEKLESCRIFVGTVATLSTKPDIFKLKRFDVAIVDEATQILEPQLLGILCQKNISGENAIGKFVLVGDHKQLPAVVLQSSANTEVYDESLRSLGICNLKDSLFERLYRSLKQKSGGNKAFEWVCDHLTKQGRMHPDIAEFPNRFFYNNELKNLGLVHQQDNSVLFANNLYTKEHVVINSRVVYFPSSAERNNISAKINHSEAEIVKDLSRLVYNIYGEEFSPAQTLGIIAPYRSQIALIKNKISSLGIPELNDILVDTIERFQGSERDIIIYSFCVNYEYQLKNLCNLTEDNGVLVDRKLNVALTRARKQLYLTGVSDLLSTNSIYDNLLKYSNSKLDL